MQPLASLCRQITFWDSHVAVSGGKWQPEQVASQHFRQSEVCSRSAALPGTAYELVLRVAGLDRSGIYSVAFKNDTLPTPLRTSLFAANLNDADETQIAPAAQLEVTGRPPVKAEAQAVEQNKDVWKLAALIALLFVMVEWWIYNRRVFI